MIGFCSFLNFHLSIHVSFKWSTSFKILRNRCEFRDSIWSTLAKRLDLRHAGSRYLSTTFKCFCYWLANCNGLFAFHFSNPSTFHQALSPRPQGQTSSSKVKLMERTCCCSLIFPDSKKAGCFDVSFISVGCKNSHSIAYFETTTV